MRASRGVFLMLLVILLAGTVPVAAGAQQDTMHVAAIEGFFSLSPRGPVLNARVLVHDWNDDPLGSVLVDVSIFTRCGTAERSRYTKDSGWARFAYGCRRRGVWTLCVDNLTLDGYTYNPDDNVLTCMDWEVHP